MLLQPINRSIPVPTEDTTYQPYMIDDEHLIRVTFAQDPVAGCELLFKRYYGPLRNHAVRFVYSRDIAEDLVADVFCNFWDNRIYEQITSSYRAYLFKAVRNRAYNYMHWEVKKDSNAPYDGLVVPDSDSASSPETTLLLEELHQRLEQRIQELPHQCRKVFLLSRIEGKSYREISDELGLSVRTVEVHIRKALAAIRQMLTRDGLWLLLFLWLH